MHLTDYKSGRPSPEEIYNRALKLSSSLNPCTICPRECRARRLEGERGLCGAEKFVVVSSYGGHFGEERVLVGKRGSGTIFFSGCNLKCIFCQNYEISWSIRGVEVDIEDLAEIMLELQDQGRHNINLVTPTHYSPQIMAAIGMAKKRGLKLPIVWNSGGYDKVEVLREFEGVVDIYMPDFKYFDSELAKRLSGVRDYPEVAKKALKEMYRQVGDLIIDENGLAVRGLLVRQLVLPGFVEDSKKILDFLVTLSPNTFVNIMDQYLPHYRAYEVPEINRPLTFTEYEEVLNYARKIGLKRFAR